MVDQQALGDGMQVGSGFADGAHVLILGHHPHEGVLREVGRPLITAQLAPQPAVKPAVMLGIEPMQHLLSNHTFSCQAASHERCKR